ncbi:hypothetical protein MES4922_190464 [Mesorhizobium ventifaucium]|uniref:Uncharacterized protein n=1 Tax=Mesorhizobium ventifaucium TaxID=666020 RepID=A0ABM9DPD5_9HYPH|nr:hypothetical protein MES4922_190464 [Mesorhizobium ventifaucium]
MDAFLGLPPHIHRAVVEAYIKGAIANDIDSGDFEKLVEPWLAEEASIGNSRKPTKNIPPKSSRRSGISGVR